MAGRHEVTGECPLCTRLVASVAPAVQRDVAVPSIARLAQVAGVDEGLAEDHVGCDAEPLVIEAYERQCHALLDCYEYGFISADSWLDGLRVAIHAQLRQMAECPAMPRLAVLMVDDGRRSFLQVRDRMRARTLEIFATHHARLVPNAEPLSAVQVELLVGVLRHEVRCMVTDGALAEPIDALADRVVDRMRALDAVGGL